MAIESIVDFPLGPDLATTLHVYSVPVCVFSICISTIYTRQSRLAQGGSGTFFQTTARHKEERQKSLYIRDDVDATVVVLSIAIGSLKGERESMLYNKKNQHGAIV